MRRSMVGRVALAIAGPAAIAAGRAEDGPVPIVTDGASFSEPKGWTRLAPGRAKTKAYFIGPESKPPVPERMILVDIGTPTGGDARETAEGLAKNWGGKVLDDEVELDGVAGFRVRAEPRGKEPWPVEGIVVHRGRKAYLLMGGAVPGRTVADEVEEVRKGWRWVAEN